MLRTEISYITLSEYLSELREILQDYTEWRWIVAEIARVNKDKNGHYWFELVEKRDSEVIAKTDGVLWVYNSRTVENFTLTTGLNLQSGMKILFYGKAHFHEKHGFRINIQQIDPTFTIGEMALRKKQVLERLEKEGLINRNKSFELPLVIQRIAVVSSLRAAGYEDFTRILIENRYGFSFKLEIFDAFVQGEEAVKSIVDALRRVALEHDRFDIVVVIRGGGSVVDLQCFDEYEIARAIAMMPLPVLTGIGHTRDITVSDHVANLHFKTPSDLAKFIIDRALSFDSLIEDYRKALIKKAELILRAETSKTENLEKRLATATTNTLERLNSKVKLSASRISKASIYTISKEKDRIFRIKNRFTVQTQKKLSDEIRKLAFILKKLSLGSVEKTSTLKFSLKRAVDSLSQKINSFIKFQSINLERKSEKLHLLSPENILKRGYSITYCNGRVLKDASNVNIGSTIDVYLYKGKLYGKVLKKEDEDGEPKLFERHERD